MSDIEHLPVRPNIGIQNNNARLRAKVIDHNTLFNNTMDPDVKRVISKNDSIDNESQITKEERITKGVKNLRAAEKKTKEENGEETPKNQWSSWIIISLAVIIIVLIIIIIYYVIQYNTTLLDKTIIPENIVRPSSNITQKQPVQTITHMPQQVYQHSQQQHSQPQHSQQPTQNVAPVKPKNFVDPTKNDLMAALKELNKTKLESIAEEEEPISPVISFEPVVSINLVKPVDSIKNVEQVPSQKIVELDDDEKNEKLMEMHMNNTLEDLIFNDDGVDAFGENSELFSNTDD
jgi:cytoskeletal protein RodZ